MRDPQKAQYLKGKNLTSSRNVIARSRLAMWTAAFVSAAWAIAAPLAEAQEKKTQVPEQTPAQVKHSPVDVNSADVKTLEALPGIGPATAQRIIEGRPYKTLTDLEKVKGLSKAKLDAIKDDLVFGSAATPATGAAKKEKGARPTTAPESRAGQQTTPAPPPPAERTEKGPRGALDFERTNLRQPHTG